MIKMIKYLSNDPTNLKYDLNKLWLLSYVLDMILYIRFIKAVFKVYWIFY